jgi:hypothetical protein
MALESKMDGKIYFRHSLYRISFFSKRFLLPMNEVNMNDLVISKKKFFIDFLDELGLFIEEKPVFTKKKILSLCRLPSPSAVISWLSK